MARKKCIDKINSVTIEIIPDIERVKRSQEIFAAAYIRSLQKKAREADISVQKNAT